MSTVKAIIKKKVTTVSEDADVRQICRSLKKYNLSGIPVTNKKGALVGFVSERDIIAAVIRPNFMEMTAKKLMTRRVVTVGPDDPLVNASKIFSDSNFRILPVVKGGKVVGIIERRDVVEHMLSKCY